MTLARQPDTFPAVWAAARGLFAVAGALTLSLTAGCGDDSGDDGDDTGDIDAGIDAGSAWEIVHRDLPGALLSVWGTSASDIWTVGSDPDGEGPTVMRFDGDEWQDLATGTVGDLWWVYGFDGGTVYLGGEGGTILAYRDGDFTRMATPRTDVTVFGIWGCSPDDVWAVGGSITAADGFAWRLDGDAWVDAAGFPAEIADGDAVWKVFGRSCDDVWLVGTGGLALHWDGASFGPVERVAAGPLFTVHASSERFVAVGGLGAALVVENDGSGWTDASPSGLDPAIGVCVTGDAAIATGVFGLVLERDGDEWVRQDLGRVVDETFHSVWIDPQGGVWAVGGQVLTPPLVDGIMIYRP